MIDVCIVEDLHKVLQSDQSLEPFLSNHDVILITYKYKVDKQQLNSFKYCNWNAVDDDKLQDLCHGIDVHIDRIYDTADEMNCALHEYLNDVINTVAKGRTVYPRHPPAPWITSEIKDLKIRRDKLYRIFKRTGYAYREYSSVRRLVKQKLTREKKRYFDHQLSMANIHGRFRMTPEDWA